MGKIIYLKYYQTKDYYTNKDRIRKIINKLELSKNKENIMVDELAEYVGEIFDFKNNKKKVCNYLEKEIKSTISVVDVYEDKNSKILNSEYSTLVKKVGTSLGIAKTIKLILELINIDLKIGLYIRNNKINYVTIVEDKIVMDVFSDIKNEIFFYDKRQLWGNFNILKIEDSFFNNNCNPYDLKKIMEIEGENIFNFSVK